MSVKIAKKFHKKLKVGKMEEPKENNRLRVWYPGRTTSTTYLPGDKWSLLAGKIVDFAAMDSTNDVMIFTDNALITLRGLPFELEIYPPRD